MENTLYIALSRQLAIKRQVEILANNIANAATAGFKGEEMVFVEYLSGRAPDHRLSFVQDMGLARDFRHGPLKNTRSPLDVAIKGEGWFVIQHEGEPHYTRNGHFRLDPEGRLVTSGGDPVLGTDNAPIVFAPADTDIVIGGDGTVRANGEERGRIRIVEFADGAEFDKTSGNLFTSGAEPVESGSTVAQGMIEQSNVRPVIELTLMVKAMRGYREAQQLVDQEHRRQLNAIDKLTRES